MKVSGFSFVKNAIKYDYPIVEAIKSILPLCDEFIVAVGQSEDDTLELIRNISSPKIKIIETVWDDSLREGGQVLAVETNKAFDAIAADSDWCFYIQGDEVFHEDFLAAAKAGMQQHLNNPKVEGLLFNYLHFYGSYDYVGDSRRWYRREVRIIRNDKSIRSYKDAQGFRKDGRKLNVKKIEASMYHYGWVKPPEKQQEKQKNFHKLWHDDNWVSEKVGSAASFDYSNIDSLARFKGTHPKEMLARIEKVNWKFDHDISKKNMKLKDLLLKLVEEKTGWRVGEYKNYNVI